jgi:large conductance mechanosensitive channel
MLGRFAGVTSQHPRCVGVLVKKQSAERRNVVHRHFCLEACVISDAQREGGMLDEFKKFALRGNVIDLAVGVIIGVAFGAIVNSLVGDIIMPVIGAITGGLDFSNYFLPLSTKVTADTLAEAKKQGAVLAWGNFLTILINFLIIAFVLFMAIKGLATLQKKEAEKPTAAPKPAPEIELLAEIRDLLKR